jgi:hypothetical protein
MTLETDCGVYGNSPSPDRYNFQPPGGGRNDLGQRHVSRSFFAISEWEPQ